MGDEPCPASFEYKPLATPYFRLIAKLAPKNPPSADDPVKTWLKIDVIDGIIFS